MLSPLSFSVLLFSTRSTISSSPHRPLPGLCLCAKSQPDKRISQVVGAVTKALAVDDKKEAILVGATVIFVINHILNQFGWINYLEGHIMTLSAKVGSSVKKALKSMISQGNDSAVKIAQVRPWFFWINGKPNGLYDSIWFPQQHWLFHAGWPPSRKPWQPADGPSNLQSPSPITHSHLHRVKTMTGDSKYTLENHPYWLFYSYKI